MTTRDKSPGPSPLIDKAERLFPARLDGGMCAWCGYTGEHFVTCNYKLVRDLVAALSAQSQCVCTVDDGLVREWVQKARAVAKSKGYDVSAQSSAPQEVNRELLAALKHAERFCPCGARPESPHTHPHAPGCPVEAAIAKAEAVTGEDA